MRCRHLQLLVIALLAVGCSDGDAPVSPPDAAARLIVDESGDLEKRLDAIEAVPPGAPRARIDALLRVMKDRSQQAYITVRDDSALGYHVEESPYGGPDVRAELRWTAIMTVERLGLVEALPDLLAALHDRHGVVRNHAARALWKLGSSKGLPVLVQGLEARAFENETANRILKEISGEDFGFDTDSGWANKSKAIERWRSWADAGPRPPRAHPVLGEDDELDRRGRFLVAMLGQHQFLFMEQARRTLSDMGDLGVAFIEQALEDPVVESSPTLRAYTVQVLRNVGSPAALARLRVFLVDENEDGAVRARAADAIGALGDADAISVLVAALASTDESLAIAAARALGRLGAGEALPGLADRLNRRKSSGRMRLTAAVSILRIGGGDAAAARAYVLDRLENGAIHERADLAEMLEEWKGELHGYDVNRPGGEQVEALAAWRTAL